MKNVKLTLSYVLKMIWTQIAEELTDCLLEEIGVLSTSIGTKGAGSSLL
jgi:hypothetical protein